MEPDFCLAPVFVCPVHRSTAPLRTHGLALRPLPPANAIRGKPKPPKTAKLPVAALGQVWQAGIGMTERRNQFSSTRAALSTGGRAKNQSPMCSLQTLTCLQVQVLPRQGMVGPSSDSRLRLGETPAGASSAVNGRACRWRKLSAGIGQPL